jgi:hypothetical protein
VTSAREIFKKARCAVPAVAAAALFALPGVAHAGGPPTEFLPDLVQEAPQTLQTQADPSQPGHFQVGFTSIVGNVGEGALEIHGIGLGNQGDMTAYQVIHMSDGPPTEDHSVPVGVVHFETDPTHDHWHFQPFDDYELRSLDGSHVYSDQKEGFCLINSVQVPFSGTPGLQSEYPLGDFCHNHMPNETEITEGISVGWGDEYTPFRGGQDVDVTGVPAGRYYLVHTVNGGSHPIKELDDNYANNSATATIDLSWPGGMNAKPEVKVLATCLAAETCPYTDPPAPPPPPPPAPDLKAPKLLLGGATRQRFLRGRAIYVYAKCDDLCKVTAWGRIAAIQVARSLRTSSTRMTLKPGIRTKIKLRISDRVRRLINKQLKRGARVTVRVSITAIDSSGNRTSSKRTLTLLPRSA